MFRSKQLNKMCQLTGIKFSFIWCRLDTFEVSYALQVRNFVFLLWLSNGFMLHVAQSAHKRLMRVVIAVKAVSTKSDPSHDFNLIIFNS